MTVKMLSVWPCEFWSVIFFFCNLSQGLDLNSIGLGTWYRWDKVETVTEFIFLGSKFIVDGTTATKLKDGCVLEEILWQT